MSRRRVIFGFVLAGLAALFAFGLGELTLRAYAGMSDGWLAGRLRTDPYAVLIEPVGHYGYRPRRGAAFTYETGAQASINSMGFRGPEVVVPKPAGTTRILLLGGSTTYGWGVNDDETIDRYMAAELARRYPDRRFEVVNLAFDGYDSYQIAVRLEDAMRLDPDFVIVNTGVNDVRNARFPDLSDTVPDPRTLLWTTEINRLRAERERGGPSLWTRAKHWFYTARVPGILRQQRSGESQPVTTPHPDALDYFAGNLRRIGALADSADAVLLLSSDPSSLRTKYEPGDTSTRTYWIRDAATTQTYRDSLDARLRGYVDSAGAAGMEVLYLPPAGIPPAHFLDDTHLAAEGNRLLALHWVDALAPLLEAGAGTSD